MVLEEKRPEIREFVCNKPDDALCRVRVVKNGEIGNFMSKEPKFGFLNRLVNGKMKNLQGLRRGKKRKRGEDIVTSEHKDNLWRFAFDLDDPRGLQRAVVYVLNKMLTLRGGAELSDISRADLQSSPINENTVLYTYTENRSKNHQPGIQAVNRDKK